MPDYMSPIFAEHEARAAAAVRAETWGHLAPEPRKFYPGWILFTFTTWGVTEPIDCNFKGLESNPWTFDDMIEYIENFTEKKGTEGTIYRFTGYYLKYKNVGFRFSGKVRRVKV